MKVNGYAAMEPKEKLTPYSYELGAIGPEQVDIKVSYCGICHSDLSMINNDWGMTQYPIVPGHEIIGEVIATGNAVKNVKVGDKVGLGWQSGSCMSCDQCMDGHHHWSWTIPLPDAIEMSKAGPLLCGGITAFSPIILAGVKPTDKVGVIGIGGLGHMAIKFLKHWGCEVIAFSSNPNKKKEILQMGASQVINSTVPEELESIAGKLNFILNTTNVTLDWNSYLTALAPKGRFHTVGAVLEPMEIPAFSIIMGEKTVGGSPIGSPALTKTMLDFCVRHNIYPDVEEFPMARVNEAIEHLENGKARFRVVLKN